AEDGIRDKLVTGVQTCALPILAVVGAGTIGLLVARLCARLPGADVSVVDVAPSRSDLVAALGVKFETPATAPADCDIVFHASGKIGRASCRERGWMWGGRGAV